MAKYQVGQTVYITNYDPLFNGQKGIITHINGEYHFIRVNDKESRVSTIVDLYRSEFMSEFEYLTRDRTQVLPEDLFEI